MIFLLGTEFRIFYFTEFPAKHIWIFLPWPNLKNSMKKREFNEIRCLFPQSFELFFRLFDKYRYIYTETNWWISLHFSLFFSTTSENICSLWLFKYFKFSVTFADSLKFPDFPVSSFWGMVVANNSVLLL